MSELSEMLDRIDIEFYLDREGIEYKVTNGSRGEQIVLRECPVCGNSAWKVYLNRETGLGNCFAGSHPEGVNFNKFSFIRAHLNDSSRAAHEAIKEIAREIGWQPKKAVTKVSPSATPSFKLPENIPLPFEGKIPTYLSKRGITADACVEFDLRVCISGYYESFVNGQTVRQSYNSRVIIPIYDLDGRLVTFQGRDITNSAPDKYKFPAGLPGTGSFLYNGQSAKGFESVVVAEGVFDVIAVQMAFRQIDDLHRQFCPIGTFGKSLTGSVSKEYDDQLKRFLALKEHGLKRVFMMWDGEKKAIKAAIKAGRLLRSLGLQVFVCILPEGRDPNEITARQLVDVFYRALPISSSAMMKYELSM